MCQKKFQKSFLGMGRAWAALAFFLVLSGCKSGLEEISGTFVGDYSRIENGEVQSLRVVTTVDKANWHDGKFRISIHSQDTGQEVATISIESRSSSLWLKSSILSGTNEIMLTDRGSCSESEPEQEGLPNYTAFCAQSDVISLFSTEKTGKYRVLLYLSRSEKTDTETFPRNGGVFTLGDILKRVKNSSYETRIATEKLYQAQEETKVVRSHLFPSIGLGGLLTLVTYPVTASSMIGSLLPFVFPTNWFQFDRRSALFESEIMAYKILVANQMSLAEDLYHNILQDHRLLAQLSEAQASLKANQEIVELQVKMGYAPESDLLAINDLIERNQSDLGRLKQGLTSQYAILSRGLGFSPRKGITSLVSERAPRYSALKALRAEDLMAEALSGSVELRQVMFLEEAAAYQEKAEIYSFINPSDWISLNESIVHRVAIARSAITEARILRRMTQGKIEEQVISLTSMYNTLLDQCQRLEKAIEEQRKAREKTELLYRNGQVSIMQVRSALEALFRVEGEQVKAEAAFASVSGKINRLLWRDAYSGVQELQLERKFR